MESFSVGTKQVITVYTGQLAKLLIEEMCDFTGLPPERFTFNKPVEHGPRCNTYIVYFKYSKNDANGPGLIRQLCNFSRGYVRGYNAGLERLYK